MSAARALAELVALGGTVEASPGVGLRVRAPKPLPAELRDRVRAEAPRLLRVASGAWRQDLEGWPAWRVEMFLQLAACRLDSLPPHLADSVAYLEALEAPEALPPVDQEEPEHQEEPAEGFQHQYRLPPEHRALPPFRWSTPPPTTRRPPPAPTPPLAGVIEAPAEPPAGPVHGPQELPERRAARHGYQIDAYGSWLEPGEASRAPHLARFSLGHRPSEAEEEARRAQLDAIEADCAAKLGPVRRRTSAA